MTAEQLRPGAVITCTTARIHGVQDGRINVGFARTPEAFVSLAWGGIGLRFRTANAAQGVLEGFAAARSQLASLDYVTPLSPEGADREYALSAVQLTWERRTPYAVVKRDAYSNSRRRTVHWVDLHMGPVTWQIVDRSGYDSVIAVLRDVHRTAVAVCLDGGKFRADPTRDDYRSPDLALDSRSGQQVPTRKSARRAATREGSKTAALIGKATNPAPSPIQSEAPTSGSARVPSPVENAADPDL